MSNKLTITLVFLGFMSCVISGVTRYLYPYHMSTPRTERIVGLGMAGTLFFSGVLLILGNHNLSKQVDSHTKVKSALMGVLMILLALFVIFLIVREILGLPEIVL